MTSTFAGGIAGAITDYYRSHGQSSFGDALFNGAIGAAIVFLLYGIINLLRSVWLEHSTDAKGTTTQGVGGALVVLAIIAAFGLGVKLAYVDARSAIVLSAPADAGQTKELTECKGNLATLTKPEAPDSLRRRTTRLVSDLSIFWSKRPAPTQQPVSNPTTDEERRRNADLDRYWREAKAAYVRQDFSDRILGIVREYKNKGVPIGFLETGAEQPDRLIGAVPYGGFALDNCDRYANEVCQLRELAFHVDAYDIRIDSSKF